MSTAQGLALLSTLPPGWVVLILGVALVAAGLVCIVLGHQGLSSIGERRES